ncbi:hypothetical protein Scep_008995 [Stephania cephalantha]|uniref:soluble epoxide hydrolase n=1 Tax=Stephania cephalantha TaxID=152367 RepID=A0AAP0PDS1_9MAGN
MEMLKSKLVVFALIAALFQALGTQGISHSTISVNGINMHIAEKGHGPVVLLLHGFPELWYTWRHQIVALAANGFRAVAPDLRGYGDTDAPQSVGNYTTPYVVGDLVALIDALGEQQVFVVGHDWGSVIAWHLCMFRPDRVKALVALSVAFQPRDPSKKPTERLQAAFGDNYYIIRFQEPGKMEAEIARAGAETVLKEFLTYHSAAPLMIPKDKGLTPNGSLPLPSWLSEADVKYYTSKYQQKGFTGPLNYYRALDLTWELTAPWTGAQVKVPTKFIVGDMDLTYNSPGVKDFIHNGGLKKFVPNLEVVVMKGVGHFINEEKARDISAHIYSFIKKF